MSTYKTAVELGRLALKFSRINRVTYHEDGVTPESDTDHTFMLSLIACELCPDHLDRGMVAQFALVHDLHEAYCGDTNTFDISSQAKAEKDLLEAEAVHSLTREFFDLAPWMLEVHRRYERQEQPEARFVRFIDKAMPKVTHALNRCAAIKAMGKTQEDLRQAHAKQLCALLEEYPEFIDTPVAYVLSDLMELSVASYVPITEGTSS